MKVLHITETINDGAGKAALNIHEGFLEKKVDSNFLTLCDRDESKNIFSIYEKRPIKLRILWKVLRTIYKSKSLFNYNSSTTSLGKIEKYIKDVDAILLYSTSSILSTSLIKQIKSKYHKPIIYTLMDIEPITGGCHFNNGCSLYIDGCKECPIINSKLPSKNWKSKSEIYDKDFSFVFPTTELLENAKNSQLINRSAKTIIHISVDKDIFKPILKKQARESLKLNLDAKVIMFSAFNLMDPRKGGYLLLKALDKITTMRDDQITLITIGKPNGFTPNQKINWVNLGLIKSKETLANIYNSADVLCVPSIDDVGPMVINEAVSCKTPVCTFNRAVGKDLIENGINGELVKSFDVEDLANKLNLALDTNYSFSNKNDDKVKRDYQIKSYIDLISSLI